MCVFVCSRERTARLLAQLSSELLQEGVSVKRLYVLLQELRTAAHRNVALCRLFWKVRIDACVDTLQHELQYSVITMLLCSSFNRQWIPGQKILLEMSSCRNVVHKNVEITCDRPLANWSACMNWNKVMTSSVVLCFPVQGHLCLPGSDSGGISAWLSEQTRSVHSRSAPVSFRLCVCVCV